MPQAGVISDWAISRWGSIPSAATWADFASHWTNRDAPVSRSRSSGLRVGTRPQAIQPPRSANRRIASR